MIRFKPLAMAAVALVAVAAPVYAAKSDAGGEVALHIDAEAAIPPDRAMMSITMTGTGATKEEALKALHAKQAALAAALSAAGLTGDAIKTLEPIKSDAPMEDVVLTEEVADASDDAARADKTAACDAATAAAKATPETRRGTRATCKPPAPVIAYEAVSVITISDLTQLGKMQTEAAGVGVPTYRYYSGTRYFTADPAAADKAAREQAIAKARREADNYAASLGYHVVRITRVSNASPPFSMRDLQNLAGYADTAYDRLSPSYFGSATYATVGIDFVIAPN
jgi:uncharacterized protein YggE